MMGEQDGDVDLLSAKGRLPVEAGVASRMGASSMSGSCNNGGSGGGGLCRRYAVFSFAKCVLLCVLVVLGIMELMAAIINKLDTEQLYSVVRKISEQYNDALFPGENKTSGDDNHN